VSKFDQFYSRGSGAIALKCPWHTAISFGESLVATQWTNCEGKDLVGDSDDTAGLGIIQAIQVICDKQGSRD
jgi:hypothetical protein